jgi:Domain of unknown function (DUF2760)
MENILLGIRVMFCIWGNRAFAEEVKNLLAGVAVSEPEPARPSVVSAPAPVAPIPAPPVVEAPARSEAITLLSVLQREARLVDFIQEPINSYTDAQIGAAVRNIHKDCAAVLDRLFGLKALRNEPEGSALEVPAEFDPGQFRLTGALCDKAPYRGTVSHPGWKATRCEVPLWNGRQESAMVVAPCEVELKEL